MVVLDLRPLEQIRPVQVGRLLQGRHEVSLDVRRRQSARDFMKAPAS